MAGVMEGVNGGCEWYGLSFFAHLDQRGENKSHPFAACEEAQWAEAAQRSERLELAEHREGVCEEGTERNEHDEEVEAIPSRAKVGALLERAREGEFASIVQFDTGVRANPYATTILSPISVTKMAVK